MTNAAEGFCSLGEDKCVCWTSDDVVRQSCELWVKGNAAEGSPPADGALGRQEDLSVSQDAVDGRGTTASPPERPVVPTPVARPILFSGPMVRALLEGRKTQTRRIVKGDKPGQPLDWLAAGFEPSFVADPTNNLCPYGKPRDLLWVRESHRLEDGGPIFDAAGGQEDFAEPSVEYLADRASKGVMGWRPSIHMPRWASRLTLEVTEVRVERVQDISEADALAEGSQEPSLVPIIGACWSERDAYAKLWRHINGPESWAANPWVWVVTFAVHHANVDALIGAKS